MNMAVKILGSSDTINDPLLPARAAQQPPPQNASVMPNTDQVDAPSAQQDNFPVPMDPGIAAMLARAAAPQTQTQQQTSSPMISNYSPSFPITGNYSPSPLDAPQSVKGNYLKPYLGNVDARGAPYPMRSAAAVRPSNTGPGGADVSGIFANLPDNTFDGARNAVQTAQAPASATPQGWNLFTALGQALGHLLGFNAAGQPQGMSGLVRNPVQPAPTQTAALRMPTPVQTAARYQGRTLLG
jgi:hypothetical protein